MGAIPEGVVADAQTHIVAVGVRDPFALTLLDADTGTVVRKVPLPGELRHLQLAAPGGQRTREQRGRGARRSLFVTGTDEGVLQIIEP